MITHKYSNKSLTGVLALAAAVALSGWGGLGLSPHALADPKPGRGGGRDGTSPDPVTDLDVHLGATTHNSITLIWTTTGDDGNTGTASLYDVRYLIDQPITEGNWDSANQAYGEPSPQPSGSPEAFTIPGLLGDTIYHLALKVADEQGNVSGLSNVVSETTLTPPPGAWSIEIVDSDLTAPYMALFHIRLAYDPFGSPAIAYEVYTSSIGDEMKFAHFDGSAWQIEVVGAYRDTDFAYDPLTGQPTISCRSEGNLMFGRFNGSSWDFQLVTDQSTNGDT